MCEGPEYQENQRMETELLHPLALLLGLALEKDIEYADEDVGNIKVEG
jgi:hypothetical protein